MSLRYYRPHICTDPDRRIVACDEKKVKLSMLNKVLAEHGQGLYNLARDHASVVSSITSSMTNTCFTVDFLRCCTRLACVSASGLHEVLCVHHKLSTKHMFIPTR